MQGITCVQSCDNDKFLSSDGKSCNSSCNTGEFKADRTCVTACPATGLNLTSSDNLSCVGACKYLEFTSVDEKRCLTHCPTGQFKVNYTCATVCPTTTPNNLLATDGVTCVSSCLYGEYLSSNGKVCRLATAKCATGEYIMEVPMGLKCTTSCPVLNTTLHLISSDHKKCIGSCPLG